MEEEKDVAKVEVVEENKESVVDEKKGILNETPYTKEGFIKLNKILASRTYVFVVILEILMLAFSIYLYFKGGLSNIIIAAILDVLLVGYPFLLKLITKSQIERSYKANEKILKDAVYTYSFNDDSFDIVFKSNEGVQKGHVVYKGLYKLIECTDYIFILVSANQAYIIAKNGFVDSSSCDKVISNIKSFGIKFSKSK